MRRALPAFVAALALLPAGGAPATSVTASRPHDPKLACKAIKRVIADFNRGRLPGPEPSAFAPIFYSDRFGEVDDAEAADFLHALRHSEGKRDRRPIRLGHVSTVHKERDEALYLVVLEREAWREKRRVEDEELRVQEIDDPRFERDTSYWLVSFGSNAISHFREAPEMYKLMSEAAWLKQCHQY